MMLLLRRQSSGEVRLGLNLLWPVDPWRQVRNGDVVVPLDQRHVGDLVDLPVVLDTEDVSEVSLREEVVSLDALLSNHCRIETLAHLAGGEQRIRVEDVERCEIGKERR